MRMSDWAKREVEIAKAKERGDAPEDEWDYGCACYDSALKAFNCLMEDGHSGMSIGITKSILNRLIDGQPLTPIEDTEDIWVNKWSDKDGNAHYQCKRMSSLFKTVYSDGAVKYSDNDRVVCIDWDDYNHTYHFGFVTRIINEMFPIEMPYIPNGQFKVKVKDFLVDPKNGDFDTVGIYDGVKPDGELVSIYRYFKESENGWDEIDKEEYYNRMFEMVKNGPSSKEQ